MRAGIFITNMYMYIICSFFFENNIYENAWIIKVSGRHLPNYHWVSSNSNCLCFLKVSNNKFSSKFTEKNYISCMYLRDKAMIDHWLSREIQQWSKQWQAFLISTSIFSHKRTKISSFRLEVFFYFFRIIYCIYKNMLI